MENLDRQIQLASQAPYKLAFKSSVAGSAASVGQLDTSLKLVMETLLVNPFFLPANEVLTINRLLDGDLESAMAEFENILRIDPSSKLGYFGLTVLLCMTGHQQDALNGLLEMTEDSMFEEAGHYLLQRLLGLTPESYLQGSLFKKLSTFVMEGKTKTAHDLLVDISHTPETPRLHIVLADFLVARGERKSAKKILEQLSDSHPHYPQMLYDMGKLELAENNNKRANELFQSLLETDPAFIDADNLLSGVKSQYSEPSETSELKDLRMWCLDVVKRIALAQKPIYYNELERKQDNQTEETPQTDQNKASNFVDGTVELPKIEEVPVVERHHELIVTVPPQPTNTAKNESTKNLTDDEPDKATQEIQISRTRKILEQAKKILDQTRVEVDKQREEQLRQDLIAEAQVELEKQRKIEESKEEFYDGPTLFDFDSKSREKSSQVQVESNELEKFFDFETNTDQTTSELTPENQQALEVPVFEDAPKRIVLPTSDQAPQNTPERAWQLLKAGEAEEAFMMFSKLLKR